MSEKIDVYLFQRVIVKEATLKQGRKIQIDKYEPAEVEYIITIMGIRNADDINALWMHVENKLEDWEKRKRNKTLIPKDILPEEAEEIAKDLGKVTKPAEPKTTTPSTPYRKPLSKPKGGK